MILPAVPDPRLVTVRRGGLLSDADHRLLALWAAACAERVLGPVRAGPPRRRPTREALAHVRAWVRGEARMMPTRGGRRPRHGRRPGPARCAPLRCLRGGAGGVRGPCRGPRPGCGRLRRQGRAGRGAGRHGRGRRARGGAVGAGAAAGGGPRASCSTTSSAGTTSAGGWGGAWQRTGHPDTRCTLWVSASPCTPLAVSVSPGAPLARPDRDRPVCHPAAVSVPAGTRQRSRARWLGSPQGPVRPRSGATCSAGSPGAWTTATSAPSRFPALVAAGRRPGPGGRGRPAALGREVDAGPAGARGRATRPTAPPGCSPRGFPAARPSTRPGARGRRRRRSRSVAGLRLLHDRLPVQGCPFGWGVQARSVDRPAAQALLPGARPGRPSGRVPRRRLCPEHPAGGRRDRRRERDRARRPGPARRGGPLGRPRAHLLERRPQLRARPRRPRVQGVTGSSQDRERLRWYLALWDADE